MGDFDEKYEAMSESHVRGFKDDLQKIVEFFTMLLMRGEVQRASENITKINNLISDMLSSLKMAWRTCYSVENENRMIRQTLRKEREVKTAALLEISKLNEKLAEFQANSNGPNSLENRLARQSTVINNLQNEVEELRQKNGDYLMEINNLQKLLKEKEERRVNGEKLLKDKITSMRARAREAQYDLDLLCQEANTVVP